MFLTTLFLFLAILFAFDPVTFAQTAGPIAVAIMLCAASFGLNLHGSRVRSVIGLLASIYAAAAPYVGVMPSGTGRVCLFIGGVLLTALSERLQGGTSTQG